MLMFKKKIRDKEYWKEYIRNLSYEEMIELTSAILEVSINMKDTIKKVTDDRSHS